MVMNTKKNPKRFHGKQAFYGSGCSSKPSYSRVQSLGSFGSFGSSAPSSSRLGNNVKTVFQLNEKQLQLQSMKQKNHKAEVLKNARSVCGDWSEHVSSSGKLYYYNCQTEISQWERPEEWTSEFLSPVSSNTDELKVLKKKLKPKHIQHFEGHQSRYQQSPNSIHFLSTGQGVLHMHCKEKQNSVICSPVDGSTDRIVQKHNLFDSSALEFTSSMTPDEGVNYIPLSQKDVEKLCKSPKQETSGEDMCIDVVISPDSSADVNTKEIYPLAVSSQCSVDVISSSKSCGDGSDLQCLNMVKAITMLEKVISALTVNGRISSSIKISKELPPSSFLNEKLMFIFDSIGQMFTNPFYAIESEQFGLQALQILQNLDMQILWPQHQLKVQELIQHLIQGLNSNQNPVNNSLAMKYSDPVNLILPTSHINSAAVLEDVSEVGHHCSDNALNDASRILYPSCIQSVEHHENVHHSHLANAPCGKISVNAASITLLTSSPAKYFDICLTQHVVGWQSDSVEKQANRTAEEVHVLGNLHSTQVSGELKRLRSMIRSNEIIATVNEQRAMSINQLIQELS